MVTISHIVNKLVDERIYLHEAISNGIASYGSVAKHLKPIIENELGRVKSLCDDNKSVFVVYKCNNEWGNYQNYTAAKTNISDLKKENDD